MTSPRYRKCSLISQPRCLKVIDTFRQSAIASGMINGIGYRDRGHDRSHASRHRFRIRWMARSRPVRRNTQGHSPAAPRSNPD